MLRRIKLLYIIYNIFHWKRLRQNLPFYKILDIKKFYFSPISSKDFLDKDESMINVAKKVFRTKCFSTAQIKNLAVLFLNDEGRYRFYDAAMLYITDFSNFKNLGETIQDEYYKKRFSALLPNQ